MTAAYNDIEAQSAATNFCVLGSLLITFN